MFRKLLWITALILFLSAPLASAEDKAASEKDNNTKTQETSKDKPAAKKPAKDKTKELTLDEVLQNYYKAIGGLENWREVNTMILKGAMLSMGNKVPVRATYMRPNKCNVEFKVKDAVLVQAYDGENGWQFNPKGDIKLPHPMSKGRSNYLNDTCDIDGPLNDYEKKGNKIEFLGLEEVYGKMAYKLKIKHKTGNTQTYYLDSDTFLPFRLDGVYDLDGVEHKITTSFFDYKKKGNLMIPYRLDFDILGAPGTEQMFIRTVRINPPVKESHFNKPQ